MGELLIVNPNNRLPGPLPGIEPPLWAGLISSYWGADILDAEAEELSVEQTANAIKASGAKNVIIVVMGNNPSVSSTPKMPAANALAERLIGFNVSMTGIHPIAAGCNYTIIKEPFHGFPMIPWPKLPMGKYRAHNWHCLDGSPRSPYASIYTSLGCPFHCYYCNINTLYGDRRIRFRPVKDVITEVKRLTEWYGVRNIKIWDELFTLNEDRVLDICEGLKPYHLLYGLNIWAYARLDTVTPKMLKGMKAGGINWLAYGFESTADKKFKRAAEVVKMTKDAGIAVIANFMFGAPGTTLDDDRASVEFCHKALPEFVNFYDAKPYPGSKWYEDVKTKGDWSDFNQYKQPSAFRQKAFREYFSSVAYMSMIMDKWGEQAGRQIVEMLSAQVRT